MPNKTKGNECPEDPDGVIDRYLNVRSRLARALKAIPEGGVTTNDIFQSERTYPVEEGDDDFRQSAAIVLGNLQEGTLSFAEAAETLEMSLREFLEIFVLEEWLGGVPVSPEEKEQLLDEWTDDCERDVHGCTFRQFIEENVLDDDFFSALNITDEDAREQFAEKALAETSTERLGPVLREQLSLGAATQEFVQEIVLSGWLSLQIPDEARDYITNKTVAALQNSEEYIFNTLWFSALAQRDRTIPDSLIEQLGEAIACRDTERAAVLLAKWDHRTILMSPYDNNAPFLLSYYAQWIDFDSSYLVRVKELLPKFRIHRRTDPLELAHLDIAEGLVEFHGENYDAAIPLFKQAMQTADKLPDDDLIAVSRYCLSRCLWKKGLYSEGAEYAEEAIRRSDSQKRVKRVAAIKMVQGWLYFLRGDFDTARGLLEQAEAELKDTDPINHGNVLSFYGRLDIKEGRYDDAMKHFREAIDVYLTSDRKHPHPNVARTHTNMAIACYDQARQLPPTRESRSQLRKLRRDAIDHLDAAQHIYDQNPTMHHRGLGKVHYLRALMYANVNERDRAQKELEKAYLLGEAKGDHLLMGRVKRVEYKITPDPVNRLALSEQTLVHAKQTDNRTLLARAYLNLASVLKSGNKADEAEHYISEATKCLTPNELNRSYWREAIQRACEGNSLLSI